MEVTAKRYTIMFSNTSPSSCKRSTEKRRKKEEEKNKVISTFYPVCPSKRLPFKLRGSSKGATAAGGPESDPSSPTIVMSPGGIYQPEWGVTNGCRLDTPSSCQELVDHLAPPGYFSELRHLPNEEFLGQFNMTLARQVVMGSQLRLLFEQEAKLLRKFVTQVARRGGQECRVGSGDGKPSRSVHRTPS
ncbi:hypothetical protein Tco_1179737 [Tanacetum coccineum]